MDWKRSPGVTLSALIAAGLILLALAACSSQTSAGASPSPSAAPASAAPAAASPRPAASAAAPTTQPSGQPVKIRLGVTPAGTSDAGLLIAEEKGYFKQEGLDVQSVPFTAAADMIAPLGAGQLDVGSGAPGVGLDNAIARGLDLKIVADKGNLSKGHGYNSLVVRKDLWDAGVRTPAAFKGRKTAIPSTTGITPEAMVNKAMATAGLKARDLDLVALGFPDMVAALRGKSIDLAVPIEPFITQIVKDGLGVVYQRGDQVYPDQQVAVILYSGSFIKSNPDAAKRFMVAYLKGVRDYDDAFDKHDPTKKAEVVSILTKDTAVKDKALYDEMPMPGLDPNGKVNVASLTADQQYYIDAGLQKQAISMDKIVDPSFAQYAVQQLGPYK